MTTLTEIRDALGSRQPPITVELVVPAGVDPNSVELDNATHDSRRARPGMLFIAVEGAKADGHDFAEDAAAAGVTAFAGSRPVLGGRVPMLVLADTRTAMGPIAAAVHREPARAMRMIGVTGTNGKTTTAHAIESILRSAGRRVAVIGTLTQKRTTPEATDLQERLAELRDEGVHDVVMEVTSHALELHRVAGVHFDIAVFTNLSQDHLDFHPTIEAYFRAKAKLFTKEYATRAVVNGDDPRGALLADSAQVPTLSVGMRDVTDLVVGPSSSTFTLRPTRATRGDQNRDDRTSDIGGPLQVTVPLGGVFNVMNALQAATVARLLGVEDSAIADGLANLVVPGRFERIDGGQPFSVIVDFAHTPDGLERVLRAAAETLPPGGRLISVFGCGGDRDRGKRPLMGSIGIRLSAHAFLTSDNPRSEDAAAIVADMLEGNTEPSGAAPSNVTVELDRAAAIKAALALARPEDVVVIAGKGHEQGQESGGITVPFDDRDVARSMLADIALRSGGTR